MQLTPNPLPLIGRFESATRRIRRRLGLSHVVHLGIDDERFKYRTDRGDALYLRTADWNLGGWERLPRQLFAKIAKDSRTVLDVGSYSGIYALIALAASSQCVVHAFEPMPANFARVRQNLRLNHRSASTRYLLHQVALSNLTTNRMIYAGSEPELSTASLEREFNEAVVSETPVSAVKLDDLRLANVDLMKIDVEGHESQVLEGGRELLTRDAPVVLFESLADEQLDRCKIVFESAGYSQIVEIDRRKRVFAAIPPLRGNHNVLREHLYGFCRNENLSILSIDSQES